MTVYCCFLPDLTEFTGPCCAGPERQHQFLKADHKVASPRLGIQPRYSGLRVQGTATSPLSTTITIITIWNGKCNELLLVIFYCLINSGLMKYKYINSVLFVLIY